MGLALARRPRPRPQTASGPCVDRRVSRSPPSRSSVWASASTWRSFRSSTSPCFSLCTSQRRRRSSCSTIDRRRSSTGVLHFVARFVGARTDALSAVLVSRGAMGAWGDLGDEIQPRRVRLYELVRRTRRLGRRRARVACRHGRRTCGAGRRGVELSILAAELGGQFGIIGRTVRMNGQPAVVVGVADAQFRVLARDDPRFWIPIERSTPSNRAYIRTDWVTRTSRWAADSGPACRQRWRRPCWPPHSTGCRPFGPMPSKGASGLNSTPRWTGSCLRRNVGRPGPW